jgi:hypothetical protein
MGVLLSGLLAGPSAAGSSKPASKHLFNIAGPRDCEPTRFRDCGGLSSGPATDGTPVGAWTAAWKAPPWTSQDRF